MKQKKQPKPNEDEFAAILKQMMAIRLLKRSDYSRSYIDPDGTGLANLIGGGWEGVTHRCRDKLDRLNGFALQNIIEKKTAPANEKVEDAFIDLANYAVLGLILFRRKISWRKDR